MYNRLFQYFDDLWKMYACISIDHKKYLHFAFFRMKYILIAFYVHFIFIELNFYTHTLK